MIPIQSTDNFSLSGRKTLQVEESEFKNPDLNPDLEAEVWKEFQRGSELALARIFDMYAHKLFNYGRQFTADADSVNDAIQDVFYQLIKSKHQLGTANSIKYYLFSSFRRRLLRLLKQQKKTVLEENIEKEGRFMVSIDPDYHSIKTMFTLDQKKILEDACNQLPIRQREALSLFFFEGLSYKEVAETMELSQVKSARKLLYRALDNLHARLHRHKDILRILYVFVG